MTDHETNGRSTVEARPRVNLVGIHSFRGGTGKTTLAANLAYLAARAGAKVAVVDADLQAPGLHTLFGVEQKRILHSVSEFVIGQCELAETPIDLSRELGLEDGGGKLYFLPANPNLETSTTILFEGYDVSRLNKHLLQLAIDLELDYLILDTHLGINRETLLSLGISETLLVLLRPDGQDYQGAGVLVRMAKKVGVPNCLLLANMVPDGLDAAEVSEKIGKEFEVPVAGMLPWCAELLDLGRSGLFVLDREDHPFTAALLRVSQQLTPVGASAGVPVREPTGVNGGVGR